MQFGRFRHHGLSTRFQKFAHVFRGRKGKALADLRRLVSQTAVLSEARRLTSGRRSGGVNGVFQY